VTQLRFDEALHEFTTLPGVKEDVTDIILNLKDLLVRMHTDEPVTLRLDVRGPATPRRPTCRRRRTSRCSTPTCTSPPSTPRAAWPST
jgi:DNA-directed RNA polymerase alpha subunit